MDKLLPVGSVVSLDADKNVKLMIIGYYPVDPKTGKRYTYCGAQFPSGISKDGIVELFDQNDILKVVFTGYATAEGDAGLANLQASAQPAPAEEQDLFF